MSDPIDIDITIGADEQRIVEVAPSGIPGPNSVSGSTTTALSGILKGTGSVVGAIALPADATKYLDGTGAFTVPAGSGGGSGTVTSVAASVPSGLLAISGSPITSSGTLAITLATQAANTVFAGPTSGGSAAPSFRNLVAGDLPATYLVAGSNLSDLASASTARTNLGLGTLATQSGTFSGTSSGTNTGDQDLSGLAPKDSPVFTTTTTSPQYGGVENTGGAGVLSMNGGTHAQGGAGDIYTTGGNFTDTAGGNISTTAGSAASTYGGSVLTNGGSAGNAHGGDIRTYGGTLPGGRLDLSDGGGSIITNVVAGENGDLSIRVAAGKVATIIAANNYTLTIAGTASVSGTNTGDNATNSQYSGLVSNATHTGDATGATALTVVGINGTNLAALATGILKNTTSTGVPSIASAGDFPTLNQNTTGSAAKFTTARTIGISGDLTWSSGSFDGSANVTAAGTLATVNSNVGTFGSTTKASVVTVNGKGLVTAASESTVTPAEASITFTDITTGDVSTTKHGFAPKAPNDTAKFLRGDATWAVPTAGSADPISLIQSYVF